MRCFQRNMIYHLFRVVGVGGCYQEHCERMLWSLRYIFIKNYHILKIERKWKMQSHSYDTFLQMEKVMWSYNIIQHLLYCQNNLLAWFTRLETKSRYIWKLEVREDLNFVLNPMGSLYNQLWTYTIAPLAPYYFYVNFVGMVLLTRLL